MRALRDAGGRPRVVGGCVRDWLLGLAPKDFDIEVPGMTFAQMHDVLAPFGATDIVGRSFGVIKLRLGRAEYDFSLPRRESKTGAGHRGFAVAPEPGLSDTAAAARRDFTINAIAYDPFADADAPAKGVHGSQFTVHGSQAAGDAVTTTAGNAEFPLGENAKKNLGAPRSTTGAAAPGNAGVPPADEGCLDPRHDRGQDAGRALSAGGTPALPVNRGGFAAALIDPHHGERDLRARILRHTSAAFSEDPLRVLRAFQLAARFDLTLAPETAALCRDIAPAHGELPLERIWGEWQKWAEKSTKPSRGLEVLEQTGWLAHYPELAALRATPQDPAWHPEGDVLAHTAHCCDALVRLDEWRDSAAPRRRALLLAVLAHDFGKPSTTRHAERHGQLHWISPGHESAGAPLAETFLQRIGAPRETIARVLPLVLNHNAHYSARPGGFSDPAIRRLARRLRPATIEDLCLVMRADHDGRPPLRTPETLARIDQLRARARELALADAAPRPILQGRHLIASGLKPNAQFKPILAAAFEAQLEGAFSDKAGALAWLKNYLKSGQAA